MSETTVTAGFVPRERAELADTLDQLGPGAPTLCEGWASEHLVAHLVVRERRPLVSLGNVVRPLAGYTDRVQRRLADTSVASNAYGTLVETFRHGPRWGLFRLGRLDETLNLVEFFVHHEDLRRAQPQWRARQLPRAYRDALWGRVATIARFRPPFPDYRTTVTAPGHGEVTVGRGAATRVLAGEPQELLLWLLGRRGVAAVTEE